MPHEFFSKETIQVLADSHKVRLAFQRMKDKKDLVELATEYFKNNGFNIKEK